MILFDKVRYKNFLSVGNQFQEICLSKFKNTLIVGKNGSGKSTTIEAVVYGLFGKAYRNVNKGQLINSINLADSVVEVEFRVGSRCCKVIRGQRPNIFEIYIDDKLVDQNSTVIDYQRYFENNILKMNYNMFTQIVVLGSTSYIPFMQLSPSSRREIVESILDIGIFSRMNVVVKEKSQRLKEKLSDVEYNISLFETKIDLKKRHIDELTQKNDSIILGESEYINECRDILEKNNSEMTTLMTTVEESLDRIKTLPKVAKVERELMKCENTIESAIRKLGQEVKFFQNEDNCPTCKQKIGDHHKTHSLAEKNAKKAELGKAMEQLTVELKTTRESIDHMKQIQTEIASVRNKIDSCNHHKTTQERNISISEKKIQGFKQTGDVKKHLEELEGLGAELDSSNSGRNVLLEERKYQNLAIQMLKDGGIKSRVIKRYLPKMNSLINRYLLVMDFFINFELDDKFIETIRSRNRDNFTYSSFSEGEKFRINIALLLTWREIAKMKNSVNTNLLFLDEVFDSSLDSTGIEEFLKLLQDLGESVNVFLISHKTDQLIDKFDRVLRFSKDKQFSQMEISE